MASRKSKNITESSYSVYLTHQIYHEYLKEYVKLFYLHSSWLVLPIIVAAEILFNFTDVNKRIKGIHKEDQDIKIEDFADDKYKWF